jgi:hypothetical protein
MGLVGRLHRLSTRRRALVASLLIALASTVFALYRPSVLPPGLHARNLKVGVASASVMVASPNLAIGADNAYVTQVDRAILLGDVIITPPVLDYVGRSLGIAPNQIQASAPVTSYVPRVVTDLGSGATAYSLAGSTDEFKLEVQADPSVPILHIYTQAPTTAAAVRLASSAIQGLINYVGSKTSPGRAESGPAVGILQLGAPSGGIGNSGASKEIAALVFLGVFGASLWLFLIGAQIRRGWSAARLAETRL